MFLMYREQEKSGVSWNGRMSGDGPVALVERGGADASWRLNDKERGRGAIEGGASRRLGAARMAAGALSGKML